MSDLMMHGVLNMPIDLWSDSEIDKIQRHARYVQASEKILALESAYIALTNSEQYGEDGEVKGHYCPNELLKRFDDIFNS